MNYKNHYDALISRAKDRQLSCYVEVHHIVPRCLGGSDDVENLVSLKAEEHIVAHLLLAKIYPNNQKILFAAFCMINGLNQCSRRIFNNKQYKFIREKYAEQTSKRMSMNNPCSNLNMSIDKIFAKNRKSAATIKNLGLLSGSKHPLFGKTHSPETRKRISENHHDVSGQYNPKAKTYYLCSPDGTEFVVTGQLKAFCEQHNISYSILKREEGKGRISRDKCFTEKMSNTNGWSIR